MAAARLIKRAGIVFLIAALAGVVLMAFGNSSNGEEPARKEGRRVEIGSLSELKGMLSSDEPFLLQFMKQGCPYCEVLEKQEDLYFKKSSVVIYDFVLPWEEDDEPRAFLDENLPPFEYVPALFYYDGNEIADTIDVSDPGAFSDVMESWEGEPHESFE